jgi:hypothetical protein
MQTHSSKQDRNKPALLKAVELIVAKPSEIKQTIQKLEEKYHRRPGYQHNKETLNDWMANRVISSYSTKAGLSGGATAFIGIVPGVGTAIKVFGSTTADIALCMKYQIEMTMALAHLYGHDIETEAGKKRQFIVAGLGAINMEAIKQGEEKAAKAFTILVQRYLQDVTFGAINMIFKKASFSLSKKALQKAIPFGIGAAISFSSNKVLTKVVGQKAKLYFASLQSTNVLITPYKAPEE